jgi:uncharacterized protein (TIGR02145 family)
MKKSNLLFGLNPAMIVMIALLSLSGFVSAQTKGTFTDARDGRVYAWLKIGTQTWMAENLKFAAKTGSWTYNNDSANFATYGKLYNWKTAQTACPKGWHVPSDKEWGVLIQTLGGSEQAGLKMQLMDTVVKVKTPPAPGTIALSTLLSGVRHPDGTCIGLNFWGGFWSSGKVNDTIGSNVLFAHGRGDLGISTNDKNAGFSVRCVKK